MSRYLSPAKIGLIILIQVYAEESIPSDAIVPILSFVVSHLVDHDPSELQTSQASRWGKAERTVDLVASIQGFQDLLCDSPSLSGGPGQKLWHRFVAKLWEIDSLHALDDFFDDNLSDMIRGSESDTPRPGIKLSRLSLFGSFLRRAQLEHQRLRFQDTADLWICFIRYRQPTVRYQSKETPESGEYGFDSVLCQGEVEDWGSQGAASLASIIYRDALAEEPVGLLPVSEDDVEKLLDFQIGQMQKYATRIPSEIQQHFREILRGSFMAPSLRHYLVFLDAWRAGDYVTAFDFLHRYFDYTMHDRDRLFYQYALMNLAVLQADFGCYKEAVAAMLETVAIARENRDITCLNFALNWLFHFGRGHPDLIRGLESDSLLGVSKEALAFLRVKAKEAGMGMLWSSVTLSEAKLGMSHGDSVATTFEHAVRSSQIIVERNMRAMFGTQLALQSSLWSRLGSSYLAMTACEMFLRCYASHAVFDDELKMTSRLALCLAEQGKYGQALWTLDRLEKNGLRSWKPNQYWHKYKAIVRLQRDVHHNNLDSAELLLGQLLQSKADDLEPDMSFLVDSLHIEVLARRGDLQAALRKVTAMMAEGEGEGGDIAMQVRLLLTKVSLLDRCGRPQRAFSTAMRAMTLSLRARLVTSLWQAVGAVSNVLVSMDEFAAAAELLTAVIPRSMECGSPWLAAKLNSYLADAYMGLAGDSSQKQQQQQQREEEEEEAGGSAEASKEWRARYLARAAVAVQRSFGQYEAVEDVCGQCEMMAKRATINKLMGDAVGAGECATRYAELRRKARLLSERRPDR